MDSASAAGARVPAVATPAPGTRPWISEPFNTSATTPNAWTAFGAACLTAGGIATPVTSVPACGSAATVDPPGAGALQLTTNGGEELGAVVLNTPLSTAAGLQVTFTDAAFDAAQSGADGMSLFLADASQPRPTPAGTAGLLGYVGVPGGYVGVGFDEYGNFSQATVNGSTLPNSPGLVPDTVAVRGAYSAGNPYLGGYTGTTGVAQSLPFNLASPGAITRPALPPTIRVTLTAAGLLSVEVDPRDGYGYRLAYNAVLPGKSAEPALPKSVYLGFAGATGGYAQIHQIYGVTVTPLGRAAAPAPVSSASPAPGTTPLLAESFGTAATAPNIWSVSGDACLTAGGSTTPSTSIPACGTAAPVDKSGAGALELTPNIGGQFGAVFAKVALPTSRGFQIVFTDAAFDAANGMPADGLSLILSDASLAFPAPAPPAFGGYLGYVGMAGGYLGVGFDEHGNFSSSDGNGGTALGFPGTVPNTVAIRGAFSSANSYLGGYTGTTGTAQSLPFPLDAPTATKRPANPPTMRVTLTAAGFLTVEIDPHDGNGYRLTYGKLVAGVGDEPPLPAQVYLGFASSTGGFSQVHQIYGLTVTPLPPLPMSFVPTQIPNLAAWYDASDPTTLAATAGRVSSWADKSGNGNTLVQSATAAMPLAGQKIDGLGALDFTGTQFLVSAKTTLSLDVFNNSTLFVVTNAATTTKPGSVVSSGSPPAATNPLWQLRMFDTGVPSFVFNNALHGELAGTQSYAGPAFWSAGGSATAEFFHKDGEWMRSSLGPQGLAAGDYPLVVGGNLTATHAAVDPYLGTIGEILVFNRYLSIAETQTVEGYLACKWGLQNRLPESHPFRATCPGAAAAPPLPTPSPVAKAVPVIPELRSANGLLALTIVAQQAASGTPEFTYNGSPVPPTLRVLPGDILSVTLTNSLPAVAPGTGYVNDTNLHFHGLHVSPNAPGDDSIDMLALPGQTLHYELSIPTDHPPGLYWYHTHAHGEVERQNLSGMSGALIVDGVAKYWPGLSQIGERVLIVRDTLLPGQKLPNGDRKQIYAMGWAMNHSARAGSMRAVAVRANDSRHSANPYVTVDPKFRRVTRRPAASDGHCTGTESAVKGWTVNGVVQPTIGIRPGERQFWRVVNAGSDTYLDLSVDNATMKVYELDGVPITSGVGTDAQGLTVSDYVLPPASRIEFMVSGPAAGTTSYLRTLCFDAGAAGPPMPAAILATLDPAHSLSDQMRRRVQRVSPKMVTYHFPMRAPRRVGTSGLTRRAQFTSIPVARTQTVFYSDQNTINGQAYDPGGAPQFYAQSGTVEEWTIINTSSQVHTFHIHQIHFLLEAVNGVTQAPQYVLDNVNVPAASASGPGTVKLLLDFTDPRIIGTFLLHCHILSHEDAGMMAKIHVGTGPPLSANVSSLTFATPASAAQTATILGGTAPYAIAGCTGVATGTVAGDVVTVTPTATGSCFFTLSDANGLTFQVAVTVGTGPSAVRVTPFVLGFAAPTAAAQNATIAGGTPPYSVSGCTGVATAAVNGTENGVTVKPSATGTCALTISDSAASSANLAVSVNAPPTGGTADNITFHHDASRTGWYSSETVLTTANVAGGSFGLLATLTGSDGAAAFGKVYAQPLYVQNEATSDGKKHNLVIVATASDRVYAFDETTRAVVWEANFTNAAAGIRQQLSSDMGCDDVNPNVGITGTPVIDRARDRLYVVVPTYENGTFHMRLHALALASGADAVSPVEVTATIPLATGGVATVSAVNNFNRSSLLEANGNIYVPLGSHCDFQSSTTHGWVLAFSAGTLAASGSALDVTGANPGTNYFLGALWGSGFGPDADAAGNVYFATGNGPYNGSSDFGMSVVRVPGDLDITKASTFTPFGAAGDSAADGDLAAGGVVLLPTVSGAYPRLLLAGGKCGAGSANGGTNGCQKYVLNRDALGGFRAGDAGALWHADTAGGMWGGPATFQAASGTNYVVYGGGNPLSTYTLGLAPLGLTVQSSANVGCLECRDQGSQPVVSSNGTLAGTAVVWALQTPGNSGGTISLYAFDALNMSHTLFSGAAGTWTIGQGASYIGGALVSPTVANGRVYVPTDGGVAVFGLKP